MAPSPVPPLGLEESLSAQLEPILGMLVGNSDPVPGASEFGGEKTECQGGQAGTRAQVFPLLLIQGLAVRITQGL